MKKYQVIVIGGGTSGMMAAIHAAKQGSSVLLIEKNARLGRKLLLTGGGRCNVTNRSSTEELIAHIPGNGKFLYSVLHQFNQEDIVDYFTQQGIELKEEDHGRIFPCTDSARTIRNCLQTDLLNLGVEFISNSPAKKLLFSDKQEAICGVETEKGDQFLCSSVIIATGGKAYPRTGSSGDGYRLAQSAGHSLTEFYPTEVPLLSNDPFIQDKSLQGISLRNVKVSLVDNKKKTITSHQMDMIFTHFGYSGPAILRCSGHVNRYLNDSENKTAHLSVDILPHSSIHTLKQIAEDNRNKQVTTLLSHWMPEKLSLLIMNLLKLDSQIAYKQVEHAKQDQLWQMVKAFPLTVYGSQPIEKGFITGGGVELKEINPQTMESKLVKGLYFCGEVLDINGYTGGYNITAAFATGAVAGQHAAWSSF